MITCQICITEDEEKNLVNLHDNCGHYCHSKCILKWAQQLHFVNVTCPFCRKILCDKELDIIGSTNTVHPNCTISSIAFENQLNSGKNIYAWNSKGMTLLHKACNGSADPKCIQFFENSDFNINSQNQYGDTPLHIAIVGNQFTMACMLASNSNIKNLKNNKGISISDILVGRIQSFRINKDTWRSQRCCDIKKLLEDKDGFSFCLKK